MTDSDDISTDTSGRETDLGASTSRGTGRDAHATGDGQATRGTGSPVSPEEAERSDVPERMRETPEDLKLGSGRGDIDPDEGAGRTGGG